MSSGYISAALLICCFMNISCKQNEKRNPAEKNHEVISLDLGNDITPVDVSPPDIIYFPADYPLIKMKYGKPGPPVARIIYSRPHKKGRNLFGTDDRSLCPYGKPWRMGANEATELELFRKAVIDGKSISAGRYSLYCIPDSLSWVIAINSNIYNWGLDIDSSKDIHRTIVPVERSDQKIEDFTMYFREISGGMELVILWDNIKASLPFYLP